MSNEMKVTKRNGDTEVVSFDKITKRVKRVGESQSIKINYTTLVMKIIEQLYDDIPTSLIDELTAQQLASMSSIHPDYGKLASALVISNLHKKTDVDFVTVMNSIYNFHDVNNEHSPLLSRTFIDSVNENADYLNSILDYERDYLIDYFGFKTLERAYLMKINNNIVERPQHMWMRVAVSIHGKDKDMVKETYDLLSQKYFTHATPTLFNAGTPRPQLSSCYLIAMEDDSVDGIYNTLKECANISKWAGGIGLHIHNVRGKK
jgi:ribonucleotide reductase alpha subunit